MAEEQNIVEEKKPKTVRKAAAKAGAHPTVVVKKQVSKENTYLKGLQYYGTGRRKNSVARVYLRPGSGKFIVNEKEAGAYFDGRRTHYVLITKPLKITNLENKYDISVMTNGGGKSGQAGAVAHGLARALVKVNPDFKKILKVEGMITRDSRVKESKKFGRKKARKRYTYRKR